MHYTTGLAGPASLGGAGLVAGQAGAASLARMLLEACGGLFALYLLFMLTLAISGRVMRRTAARELPSASSPFAAGRPEYPR